jgi:hypothetical protein
MLTFTVSDKEQADGDRWAAAHGLVCDVARRYETAQAAIAESPFSWSFHQTSIAVAVNINCACGAHENVSDVSQW